MTNRTYNDLHADLTEWLEGVLKNPENAARWATAELEIAESVDGAIHVEVKGFHSNTGNPVTGKFADYDHADEIE